MNQRDQNRINYYDICYSWIFITAALAAEIGLVLLMALASNPYIYGAIALIVLMLFLLSFRMVVVVDNEVILLSYGIGLFVTEIDLFSVERSSIEPNNFVRAWFYRPTAQNVLLVHLRGGGKVAIPTDTPKDLAQIINFKISRMG